MKKANIQLFAYFREKVGRDELEMPLQSGDTVEDLYFWLLKEHPQAAFPLECLRFAVNGEYADKTTVLQHEDEVVLIPPVAGG